METVFQYRIPVLHPVVVHFPLSLIVLAGLAAVVWMIVGAAFWRRCTLLLLTTGMGGALFAYFTGEAMEAQSEGVPIVDELVHLHEDMALYTLIVTGLALAGFAGVTWWQERRAAGPTRLGLRLALGLLALAAALLVAWTGHIGGTMVWGVPA